MIQTRQKVFRMSPNVPKCPIQTHHCPNGLILFRYTLQEEFLLFLIKLGRDVSQDALRRLPLFCEPGPEDLQKLEDHDILFQEFKKKRAENLQQLQVNGGGSSLQQQQQQQQQKGFATSYSSSSLHSLLPPQPMSPSSSRSHQHNRNYLTAELVSPSAHHSNLEDCVNSRVLQECDKYLMERHSKNLKKVPRETRVAEIMSFDGSGGGIGGHVEGGSGGGNYVVRTTTSEGGI